VYPGGSPCARPCQEEQGGEDDGYLGLVFHADSFSLVP